MDVLGSPDSRLLAIHC
ncbi:hypothetical protein HaLaN_13885, partial [Haematococcus lacustris]